MDNWLKDTQDFTEKKDTSGNSVQNTKSKNIDVNDAFDQIANHYVEYKTKDPIQNIQKPQEKPQVNSQVKNNKKPKQKKKSEPKKVYYEEENFDDEYDDTFDNLYDKYK